ncbi:MAG TPA: hypothetical protein VGP25_17655, partial [Gemmatimonadaceae bacterium]|nr:hypothetical protein [Gemmatimonadaceae bacterium]
MRYATSLATTLALVAAVGCSSDSVTDNRTLIGLELAMTPSRDTLFLGGAQSAGTTKVAASATVSGKPVTLPGHVFESADTAIATISSSSGDATATVTAAGLGTTTVAVRVNGMRA